MCLKAIAKFLARTVNDDYADSRDSLDRKIAYKRTGKKLNRSHKPTKKQGQKIYKEELAKQQKKTQQRHDRIDKFIDDV